MKSKAEFQGSGSSSWAGDSAVDWALNLLDTARRITLIHRRPQFRAHEASVKELMKAHEEGRPRSSPLRA